MDDKWKKLEKSLGFMDRMVRMIFYGTFVFTVAILVFVWFFKWEDIMSQLIDSWFRIMVGELLIMGVIQIGKQIMDILNKKLETEVDLTLIEKEPCEDGHDVDEYTE